MVSPEFVDGRPDWIDVLVQRATRADAQPPFSDGSLVGLATGSRRVLAIGDVAAALVGEGEAEFVVDPDARRHGHGTRLIEALLAGDPAVRLWAHGDHPAARRIAASHGLAPVRELLQLRATGFDTPARTSRATQPVGADDLDDWLDLNSRAFAAHPEQGRVTRADLDVLMAEPWFDANDFLLLREDSDDGHSELVGYCWLKVEGGSGEFYVVGVPPERQGEGLGRRLVQAGLSRLLERGIRTASLYVEADNEAALRLYRSFGFTDHSIDIQYAAR